MKHGILYVSAIIKNSFSAMELTVYFLHISVVADEQSFLIQYIEIHLWRKRKIDTFVSLLSATKHHNVIIVEK